jgi:hypothetical protein
VQTADFCGGDLDARPPTRTASGDRCDSGHGPGADLLLACIDTVAALAGNQVCRFTTSNRKWVALGVSIELVVQAIPEANRGVD